MSSGARKQQLGFSSSLPTSDVIYSAPCGASSAPIAAAATRILIWSGSGVAFFFLLLLLPLFFQSWKSLPMQMRRKSAAESEEDAGFCSSKQRRLSRASRRNSTARWVGDITALYIILADGCQVIPSFFFQCKLSVSSSEPTWNLDILTNV